MLISRCQHFPDDGRNGIIKSPTAGALFVVACSGDQVGTVAERDCACLMLLWQAFILSIAQYHCCVQVFSWHGCDLELSCPGGSLQAAIDTM